MDLTLSAVLAAMLFFGLLVTCAVMLGRGPSDIVLLFVLVFGMFYGFRPLLFIMGLDGPYPAELFFPAENPELLTLTLLGLSAYLLLAMVGIAVITQSGLRGWAPFFVSHKIDLRRALLATMGLTALAALVSAVLLVSYGGVGGVISAAKYEKELTGMYVLKAVPAVGAVVAAATFIEARTTPQVSRWMRALPLVFAFLNAFFVFMWGTRSVMIIVAATLVLGMRPRRPRPGVRRERVLVRLLVAVVLVVVAASGMRVARDTLSHGEVQQVYAESSTWRQASVGTNSIYFDAAMLSFRDWPSVYPLRSGEDFYNGVVGVVPRALWSGKPEAIPPGNWFRRVYEPRKVNGWPMGAGALWYLNFGWLGLLLGGLFSGVVIGMVAAAQRRKPQNGFNTGVAVIAAVLVLPLGWDNQVLMKFVIWLVPMWLVGRYIAPLRRQAQESATSASLK